LDVKAGPVGVLIGRSGLGPKVSSLMADDGAA